MFFVVVLSSNCAAQGKSPVYVDAVVGDGDNVGQIYVFNLKEAIRGSQSFRLIEDNKQRPYIRVSITTRDAMSGNSSAIGYALAYDSSTTAMAGILISSGVQTCGRQVTAPCAQDLLPWIDRAIDQLRQYEPKLHQTLK